MDHIRIAIFVVFSLRLEFPTEKNARCHEGSDGNPMRLVVKGMNIPDKAQAMGNPIGEPTETSKTGRKNPSLKLPGKHRKAHFF